MSMSVNVGAIDLGLDINQKHFNRQLYGIAGGATRSAMKAFGGIGAAIGITMGTAAAVNFAKSAVSLGSNLTEVQNVVDTVFPSMNNQVNNFAKNAMNQFGLSETVAKKYTGTLGAMSKAIGFNESQSMSMATAVAGMSGDVASFFNMTSDEAYTKLKSIWTGETESLKDLGIIMTQTNLDQYALNEGLGETTKTMTEQEKAMLRFKYVMSGLSDASGDFARTSGSWANQLRVLSLSFESLKATIGQGLINIFTPIIRQLNELIVKLQIGAEYFKAFTEMIFGEGEASSQAANASSELASTTDEVGSAVKGASKAINKSLASFDQLNVIGQSASDSLAGLAASSNIDTSLFGASGDGTIDYGINVDVEDAKEKMKEFFEQYKEDVKPLVKPTIELKESLGMLGEEASELLRILSNKGFDSHWLVRYISSSFAGTLQKFSGYVKQATGILKTLNSFLSGDFNNAEGFELMIIGVKDATLGFIKSIVPPELAEKIDEFDTQFEDMWKTLRGHIIKYGDESKLEFTDFIDFFKVQFTNSLKNILPESFREMWGNIFYDASTKWEEIKTNISTRWHEIKNERDRVFTPFANWFGEVFSTVKEAVGLKIGEMKEDAVSKFEEIKADLSLKVVQTKNKIVEALSPLRKALSDIWDGIKISADNSWKAIINIIRGKINGIIDAMNYFIRKYNSLEIGMPDVTIAGKTIEGFSVSVPKIDTFAKLPMLANGGLVSAPTLAMVGDNKNAAIDPEVVSPLSKLQKMIDAGGSNEEMIALLRQILELLKSKDLVIQVGETEFGRIAIDAINSLQRQTGKTLLRI